MKTTRLGQKKRDAREAMGTPNQQGTVEFIKQDLIERGVIPNPQTTNCHSAEITIRLAWATRKQGAMLFAKTMAQNGCQKVGHPKVGHDAVAYPDGWVDILISAGPPANENRPTWDWHPGAPTGELVAPWDLDAGAERPPKPPDPELQTPPLETQALAEALRSVAENLQGLRADLALLNDVLTLDTKVIGDALEQLQAEVAAIRETQGKGLGGSLFSYRVRLVP